MKNISKNFSIFIMSILMTCSISCDKQGNPNLPNDEEKSKINQAIQLMLSKHDAVSIQLGDSPFMFDPVYTVELEKILVRSDGRPIFFFASLIDLRKEDEQYIAHLKIIKLGGEINYELMVTKEQVNYLVNQDMDTDMHYAVVAEISAIKRKEFAVQILSYMDEEPIPEIESPYIFLSEGTCIDIFFVGRYGDYEWSQTGKK